MPRAKTAKPAEVKPLAPAPVVSEATVTEGPMPEIKEVTVKPAPSRTELEAQIAKLQAQLAEKKEAVEVAPLEEVTAPKNETPIPADYQTAVKDGLNSQFRVEIEYSSNTPFFGFSILVPKTYSNAPKPHWDMYNEDRRTRMISNAEGLQGVKQWVERVYNNFDNETKARITSDRQNQNG